MNTTKINKNEEKINEKLLNIDQVCKYLGIKQFSVYKLINQKRLKSVKIGTRRLISHNALQRFITELEEEYGA